MDRPFSGWANYRSGSGTNELVFSYRIEGTDHRGRNHISIPRNGLQLNGGTITGAASGAGVSLSHPSSSRYGREGCTTPTLAPVPSTHGDPRTLVSNFGQTVGSDLVISGVLRATSFRTGGSAVSLSGVTLALDVDTAGGTFNAFIYSDNAGVPGASVHQLTNPATFSTASNTATTFTSSGFELSANTTYWVVVARGTEDGDIRLTTSASEDAGKATGWSIGDGIFWRFMGTWSALSTTSGTAFRMTISGTVLQAAPPTEVSVTKTADGFRARWRPPAGERAEDSLARYDLRYRQAADAAWTDGPQYVTGDAVARSGGDAFDRAITVTGGEATSNYEVQVRAYNAIGRSPWSASGSSGPFSSMALATVAPAITGQPEVSASGDDGQWGPGETVEVTLTFDEAVAVDTAGGTPSVGLSLGGSVARSAPYVRGSGTTALVFAYTLADADGSHASMMVPFDSLALNGGTIRSVATGTDASLSHVGASVLGQSSDTAIGDRGQVGERDGFTARFERLPESNDGSTAFTFELHFSAAPDALSYRTVGGGLLEVSGANVTGARRLVKGDDGGWEVTVEPTRGGDITMRLPARACTEANAVCAGGAPLARAATATVPGVPFTASFSEVPTEHDGQSEIELRFSFSEAPAGGFSYRTVRDGLFDVTGGTLKRVYRRDRPENVHWGLQVVPSGLGDVTLTVRATTDCAAEHAVCTADGRMLAGRRCRRRVLGPAALTVADAEVEEADGATLAFTVTMSRARHEATTVKYATSDGTATAGLGLHGGLGDVELRRGGHGEDRLGGGARRRA